jgi:hypothetical protein
MKKTILIEIISFCFIVLFVYTAFSKIVKYEKFYLQIAQSPILTGFGSVIAPSVIAVELGVSILLVIPSARLFGFYCCFALMTMFTSYIIAILYFSIFVPCSCGGVLENLTWHDHIIFNGVFVLLALAGIYLSPISNKEAY